MEIDSGLFVQRPEKEGYKSLVSEALKTLWRDYEPQPRQTNDRLFELMPPLERVYDGSGDSARNNVQQAISDFFSRAPRNENDIIVLNREV